MAITASSTGFRARNPWTGEQFGAEFVEVLEAESTTERQYEMFFEPQMARVELSATSLSDGRVVVIGGRAPSGAALAQAAEDLRRS